MTRVHPHRFKATGAGAGKTARTNRAKGDPLQQQPAPAPARMVEVDSVGRLADKPKRGPRQRPLNEQALKVLAVLSSDWLLARELGQRSGLSSQQASAALRELRAAGKAQSRPASGQRQRTEWQARA